MTISKTKKACGIACALVASIWPAIMIYLFYLGLSTHDWLSDQFLKWEGISFIFAPPFIFGTANVWMIFDEWKDK